MIVQEKNGYFASQQSSPITKSFGDGFTKTDSARQKFYENLNLIDSLAKTYLEMSYYPQTSLYVLAMGVGVLGVILINTIFFVTGVLILNLLFFFIHSIKF